MLDEATSTAALLELAENLAGQPIPRLRMAEREFVQWCPDGVRAEWVDGEVIVMSPANTEHVDLAGWLDALLRMYVEQHELGKILAIESQIRLAKIPSRRSPDLLFISKSRASIIKPTYIDGPPDLAIEIVSRDSESRDRREKFLEYESAGVREYWIIDPATQTVELYVLSRDRTYKRVPEKDDKLNSKVLRGLYLKPEWLFKSPLPKLAPIFKQFKLR